MCSSGGRQGRAPRGNSAAVPGHRRLRGKFAETAAKRRNPAPIAKLLVKVKWEFHSALIARALLIDLRNRLSTGPHSMTNRSGNGRVLQAGEPSSPRSPRKVIEGTRIPQDLIGKMVVLHGRFLTRMPNSWRIHLKDCDLSGLDLRGLNLSEGHFVNCDFSGADLEDAHFVGSDLFSACFDKANLTRTNFSRSDMRGARFDGAELDSATLDGADLGRGVVFRHGAREGSFSESISSFRNANLRGTNLAEAKLSGVNFEGAALHGVNMQGADLRGANFSGAKLVNVALQNANLMDADLRAAIMDEATARHAEAFLGAKKSRKPPIAARLEQILGEHLLWIQSDRREGMRADFSEMYLAGFDFSGRILAGAKFERAILSDANLTGAILAAANLRDAVLVRANLTRADLRGADLRGADMRETLQDRAVTGTLVGTTLATRRS